MLDLALMLVCVFCIVTETLGFLFMLSIGDNPLLQGEVT